MADISERLTVRCPSCDAARHVAAFIAEHLVSDGTVSIPFRLPIGIFSDRRTLIERRVVATLYPLSSSTDLHPTYSVCVSPKVGRPFPDFAGALAVERSATDDRCGLIVSGHYEPPLGTVGKIFDAALGRRIAHAIAVKLLRTIADYVEYASARNEAARAGYIPRTGHISNLDISQQPQL